MTIRTIAADHPVRRLCAAPAPGPFELAVDLTHDLPVSIYDSTGKRIGRMTEAAAVRFLNGTNVKVPNLPAPIVAELRAATDGQQSLDIPPRPVA